MPNTWDEGPRVEVNVVRWQVARVPHACVWRCGEPIEPGQRYWRAFWIEDGRPQFVKGHDDRGACSYAIHSE